MKQVLISWAVLPMLFVASYSVQAQSDSISFLVREPYTTLYNYSSMSDTVIHQYGSYSLGKGFVRQEEPFQLCCAAIQTLYVKSGSLRKVVISDTGMGMVITRKYKRGRLVKESRKIDVKIVRNVPPYP